MSKYKKQLANFALSFIFVFASFPGWTYAQSSSTNYKIEESYFGTGGEVDATSGSYRSRQSAGSLGVGNASSASYDAVFGFVTPDNLFLEFVVSGATVNFGQLTSDTTASYGAAQAGPCNCSFYVRTYLSSEYVVTTLSQPPTYQSASLDAKTTTGAPSTDPGVEEFGINLVANTTLATFGANPINQPDNSFADGQAYGDGVGGARDYDDANQFAYGAGDIIARSAATPTNPAIGQTDYTISYIAKRKTLSEAGTYVMNHDLVVTATY